MTALTDDVRALLAGPNYAHVATLLPDGAPHTVPVWVGLEDERVAFQTEPGSRKARNLSRDPRVAISITDREQPFTMGAIRGRVAERIDGEEALVVVDRIAHKYIGQPYPLRSGRIVYLVAVEHAMAQSFG